MRPLSISISLLSLLALASLGPVAAAQSGTLKLVATGLVERWNDGAKTWVPYHGGAANEGDAYRVGMGGHLVGTFSDGTHILVKSCSAIRFARLGETSSGTSMYAKVFGDIDTHMAPANTSKDSLQFELPVGLATFGRQVAGRGESPIVTSFQSPTARLARLSAGDSPKSALQSLPSVTGKVTGVDPAAGTFILDDGQGKHTTVVLRPWSQVATRTLGERLMNETASQMAQRVINGDTVTAYGSKDTTGANLVAAVVYPPGGQFIFGAAYVLTPPATPPDGPLVPAQGTLTFEAGHARPESLPGFTPANIVDEVGVNIDAR